MHILERWAITLRHSSWLNQANWLWDKARPIYNQLVAVLGRNGLVRKINGTDHILVLPQFRGITETYEPAVWSHLMAQVKPGDIVADIGAFIGLYTIALAKRVGPSGKVISFEPDPDNFAALKAHVGMNQVSERVELIQAAVGAQDGSVPFEAGRASESHISPIQRRSTQMVRCMCLDTILAERGLDILKVDVEGYEREVLYGAIGLLKDSTRRPRVIYIEVHPYAWPWGPTDESLLDLLGKCGYRAFDLGLRAVERIDRYGEIVAVAAETTG